MYSFIAALPLYIIVEFFLIKSSLAFCTFDSDSAYCNAIPSIVNSDLRDMTLTGECELPETESMVLPGVAELTLNCTLDPDFPQILQLFPNLTKITVFNCPATVPWLPFSSSVENSQQTGERELRLPFCDQMSCACENEWLQGVLHARFPWANVHVLNLPTPIIPQAWGCDFSACPKELEILSLNYTVEVGDQLRIPVNLLKSFKDKPSRSCFHYVHTPQPTFREEFTNSTVTLVVANVLPEHMGQVMFVCWMCKTPTVVYFKVFVRSNITVEIIDERSQLLLVVHGWPLEQLNITLNTEPEWDRETAELSDETVYFRNRSLVLQPLEGHSSFYVKQFTLYPRQCTTCGHDLPRGNFSLTICSNETCTELYTSFDNLHPVADDKNWSQTSYSVRFFPTWPLLFLLIITALFTLIACTVRIPKMKVPSVVRRWRRESRATEETSLRLEERGSLSSDYSGQIIPVIKMGQIKINQKIGKGAFGEVYSGTWSERDNLEVAVKSIVNANGDLEREANMLSKLHHKNIVRMLGMTQDADRLLLIFEIMNLGDLKQYLRDRRPRSREYAQVPPPLELFEMKYIVRQILEGLCYLNSRNIVHRDLAARNCLVSGGDDTKPTFTPQPRPPFTVKISDFGLSRSIYSTSDYYRMSDLPQLTPARWWAPEGFCNRTYSSSSDIWALGVTCWEIFSYGDTPFPDLSNREIVILCMTGARPPKLDAFPDEIYDFMMKCWQTEASERVTASEALLEPCLQGPDCGPPEGFDNLPPIPPNSIAGSLSRPLLSSSTAQAIKEVLEEDLARERAAEEENRESESLVVNEEDRLAEVNGAYLSGSECPTTAFECSVLLSDTSVLLGDLSVVMQEFSPNKQEKLPLILEPTSQDNCSGHNAPQIKYPLEPPPPLELPSFLQRSDDQEMVELPEDLSTIFTAPMTTVEPIYSFQELPTFEPKITYHFTQFDVPSDSEDQDGPIRKRGDDEASEACVPYLPNNFIVQTIYGQDQPSEKASLCDLDGESEVLISNGNNITAENELLLDQESC